MAARVRQTQPVAPSRAVDGKALLGYLPAAGVTDDQLADVLEVAARLGHRCASRG